MDFGSRGRVQNSTLTSHLDQVSSLLWAQVAGLENEILYQSNFQRSLSLQVLWGAHRLSLLLCRQGSSQPGCKDRLSKMVNHSRQVLLTNCRPWGRDQSFFACRDANSIPHLLSVLQNKDQDHIFWINHHADPRLDKSLWQVELDYSPCPLSLVIKT